MAALLEAAKDENFFAVPALVISNNPEAGGLQTAQAAGIPTRTIDNRDFANKADFESALQQALTKADIDIICLAGFMRLLSGHFVHQWQGRLINIHPSLLPAFPGLHVQQQAIDAGVRLSGCSVHFVDAGMDTGAIIGQAAVPVLPDDTADSLASRILKCEHRLYPHCLNLLAQERIWWQNGKVHYATDFRTDESLSLP